MEIGKLTSGFQRQVMLQSLITEREGMVAENAFRVSCGNGIAYAGDSFFELARRIEELKGE